MAFFTSSSREPFRREKGEREDMRTLPSPPYPYSSFYSPNSLMEEEEEEYRRKKKRIYYERDDARSTGGNSLFGELASHLAPQIR